MSQYGGPDGEMGASMRYLSQRYTAPNRTTMAVLTDIGTEELAHLEMVATIVHQLTRNLTPEEIEKYGFAPYYVDHTVGIWPQAAGGVPFSSTEFQSKGDPITDLHEDLAAEQKARTTYDNILRLVKDPEVADPIRFLRAREIVHFQRFGEAKPSNTNSSFLLDIPENFKSPLSNLNPRDKNIYYRLLIMDIKFTPFLYEVCDPIQFGGFVFRCFLVNFSSYIPLLLFNRLNAFINIIKERVVRSCQPIHKSVCFLIEFCQTKLVF